MNYTQFRLAKRGTEYLIQRRSVISVKEDSPCWWKFWETIITREYGEWEDIETAVIE